MAKNNKKTMDSDLDKISVSPFRKKISFSKMVNTTAANKLIGISLNTVLPRTVSGKIRAEMPNIPKILKILLPITLPIAISAFFVIAA